MLKVLFKVQEIFLDYFFAQPRNKARQGHLLSGLKLPDGESEYLAPAEEFELEKRGQDLSEDLAKTDR